MFRKIDDKIIYTKYFYYLINKISENIFFLFRNFL